MSCSCVPRAPYGARVPHPATGWGHVSWCIVYRIARQRTAWIMAVGRAWPAVPRPVTRGVQSQAQRVPPPDDMHAGSSQTSGRVMRGRVWCRAPPVPPDHASDAAGWHTAALPTPHQRAVPPTGPIQRPSLYSHAPPAAVTGLRGCCFPSPSSRLNAAAPVSSSILPWFAP
jgi:hypothetical protein